MSELIDAKNKRMKQQKKNRTMMAVFAVILILLAFGNAGMFVYNLKQSSKNAVKQEELASMQASLAAGVPDTTQASEVDVIQKPGESAEETTASVSEETTAETSAAVSETEAEKTTAAEETTLSAMEQDPRYAVVGEYENLGIICNVNNFLNIRKKASIKSVSIGKAMKYTVVEVIDHTDDGWYKIKSGDNVGYVSDQYMAVGEEGQILAMEHCKHNAFPKKDKVKVYKSANTETEVVFEAVSGNGYNIIDIIGDWVKVRVTDGLTGYMLRDKVDVKYTLEQPVFFTASSEVSKTRLNIVNYAFEWYGGDYVWGGTTLGAGVDCSGYTLRIYEHYGINLPRLSAEQATWGTAVSSMEEALPGDLLFFHGYHDGGVTEGVGHVAIYIGDGKMIHAASEARGIVVDNYNYLGEPLAIRRVIND